MIRLQPEPPRVSRKAIWLVVKNPDLAASIISRSALAGQARSRYNDTHVYCHCLRGAYEDRHGGLTHVV